MKRTLSDAILLATMAHKDQIDKAGLPYILHPLHVMQAVIQTQGPGEVAMAAVLHDVVEDCSDWPLDRLRYEGYSDRVIFLVAAVTKTPGEAYTAFIERIRHCGDNAATVIKLADISHNLSRMAHLPEEDQIRLTAKYEAAWKVLTS